MDEKALAVIDAVLGNAEKRYQLDAIRALSDEELAKFLVSLIRRAQQQGVQAVLASLERQSLERQPQGRVL